MSQKEFRRNYRIMATAWCKAVYFQQLSCLLKDKCVNAASETDQTVLEVESLNAYINQISEESFGDGMREVLMSLL